MAAENNLLLADMRKAVREYFGTFLTSIDKKFTRHEKHEAAFNEAKAELKEQINRLYAGLDKLDECETKDRAEKIKQRMINICENEVAAAFTKTVDKFMEGVIEYCEFD